jgi:hypothetical protein
MRRNFAMNACVIFLVGICFTKMSWADDKIDYINVGTELLAPQQYETDLLKASNGDGVAAERIGRHYVAMNLLSESLKWLRVASIKGIVTAQHFFYIVASSISDLDKATQIEAILWLEEACKTYLPARETKTAVLKHSKNLKGPGWK